MVQLQEVKFVIHSPEVERRYAWTSFEDAASSPFEAIELRHARRVSESHMLMRTQTEMLSYPMYDSCRLVALPSTALLKNDA